MCIIGAGIIGLCTALALLQADPELRVVLVDRHPAQVGLLPPRLCLPSVCQAVRLD